MSKSKVYKKKNKINSNIFVILAIVLVALIAVTIIFTAVDNSKYNGLMNDYIEHEYGEKQNVKLKRGQDATTGIVSYANEEYAYYVDDNIIYDLNKNESLEQGFYDKASELGADLGEISSILYQTYTDGSDFSKKYDYVELVATFDGVLGSKEAAAEKLWSLVSALNEEYNICGLYVNYSDDEALYYSAVSIMDKESVTLEKLTESMAEIKLSADAVEVEDPEAENSENAESEAETETEE